MGKKDDSITNTAPGVTLFDWLGSNKEGKVSQEV